ncbi:pyridoxamine 5'-phosphate oxidase [Methyloligella sp. 2.7D]|uniref:pyridoxamine 5'-phosphate oxidase n=1 Tax=unclassified Methyloligella TaxID=2625955 RepID=UPI00157D574D|nr:pyridoxamine 5'-phosphate oxidase [Methyloligella sp. GL2]QKP78255.1 pyridoxamine 5'-phosphate oxidase [Methyloligella sp. GL2]
MSELASTSGFASPVAANFEQAEDPFALFETWFLEAEKTEPADPNAMALATCDAEGLPDLRMILLKGHDPRGFVFYTNLESAKGDELAANPKAAICLHWKSLGLQVRARGPVEPVTEEEADAYFASRHRESQIGAWASQQSRPLASREVFEEAVREREEEFGSGEVPRPPHWNGFRLVPKQIEFWASRPFRLHDRIVFRRESPDHPWEKTRLYP